MRGGFRTPWYHGWNIVAVTVLVQVSAMGVASNCFSFFLADWSREYGWAISDLTIAIPLYALSNAFLAPISGRVSDRYPARRVIGLAMLVIILFHAVIGFVTAGWQIIALYAFLLPLGMIFSTGIPTQTLVSRWFVHRRGLAFSLSACGLVVAGILFPPLVVRAIEGIGWRETWWVFGIGIAVITMPTILLVLRDRPDEEEGRTYIMPETEAPERVDLTLFDVLRRRNFWLLIGVFVPIMFANTGLMMNFAPFGESRGLSLDQAAWLVGVSNGAALVGKLACGVLADRFGNRGPLLLVAILVTVGCLWLAIADGFVAIALATALLSFPQGIWVLLASCTAEEFGSANFGRAYGVACTFSVLTTVSPVLLARLYETTGSYVLGINALGGLGLVAVFAAFFYGRGRAVQAMAG